MRSLSWMGSSLEDLKTFPRSVQRQMGYARYLAQTERMSPRAKPLKGFAGAGVIEVVEDFEGDTDRRFPH